MVRLLLLAAEDFTRPHVFDRYSTTLQETERFVIALFLG